LDTYDPKALWDSILEYHAAKSVKNAANVMERLHDIVFVEGEMQKSINNFRQTFQLMIEVSATKFDKKTLEAVWVFFVLKRLPPSFNMFRSLQFASFKDETNGVSMSRFLQSSKRSSGVNKKATLNSLLPQPHWLFNANLSQTQPRRSVAPSVPTARTTQSVLVTPQLTAINSIRRRWWPIIKA
jgi:hypothetical protein